MIGSVLAKYDDEWTTQRYMSVGALERAQTAAGGGEPTLQLESEEEPMLVKQLAA